MLNKSLLRAVYLVTSMLALVGCEHSDDVRRTTTGSSTTSSAPHAERKGLSDPSEILAKAATEKPAPLAGDGWQSLMDGWRETKFSGGGDVLATNGIVFLGMGSQFTGISWMNEFPKMDYEIAFDAMRVSGSDFFCGLTFPVGDSFCSLICGGWGGAVTGLSSIDGADASENETTKFISYEKGKWHRIRLRVTKAKIEVWIDEKPVIDVETTGRKISLRFGEIEMSKPLGIAAWDTGAALREIKWRRIE